ncbi:hypothetical protein Pyrde_1339 [Pyrodictium delaneyi]|uniref:Uncharacterized protein n=1 Tax=Pyrodictium delaneyi TaxID=1273541 RepID=A0A0N7JD72_9CREN|nr:hypothetical protein [Pyrodictium delaneyi]ALL01385.1 hypothetical protein Pyrde_1339 [Pyrodictium delaneyi]
MLRRYLKQALITLIAFDTLLAAALLLKLARTPTLLKMTVTATLVLLAAYITSLAIERD